MFEVCACLVLGFFNTLIIPITFYSDQTLCDIISRNVAPDSYCSFTDAQFFCGSQFWPENSQSTSQDVSLSSRNSQQSSDVRLSPVIDIKDSVITQSPQYIKPNPVDLIEFVSDTEKEI